MKTKTNKQVLNLILIWCMMSVFASYTVSCSQKNGDSPKEKLTTYEVFDSLSAMLPKGSIVVARFPDEERHCMYYLNSGILYYFDGKLKNLEEVQISGVDNGSVESAMLDKDEKYISIVANFGKVNKLYRLNTLNRNIVDMDQTVASEKKTDEDPDKEKKRPKVRKEETVTETEAAPKPTPEPEREGVLQDVMEEIHE
ncbi:MAG: hypothetical protein IJK42_10970 [Prevotella sp.]|nr:hypothetical protein [Prevotella sp.]